MPTRRERALLEQQRARQESSRKIWLIVIGVIAAGIVLALAIYGSGVLNPTPVASQSVAAAPSSSANCSNIQTFPSQGQVHIERNQPHPAFSSNPPTSGWHWADPQEWGIYTANQVQEQLVHNLEHGGIIIQYNGLTPAEVQQLTQFVQRDPHHIILAPYADLTNGTKLALTAWTHLQSCTGVDENAMRAFIDEFRDKAPEQVP